jgi:hypothetical protein
VLRGGGAGAGPDEEGANAFIHFLVLSSQTVDASVQQAGPIHKNGFSILFKSAKLVVSVLVLVTLTAYGLNG